MSGTIQVGTWETPYNGVLTVNLKGNKPQIMQTDMMGGDKSLFVPEGGVIDFHGAKRHSWSRLLQTVNAGDSQIQLIHTVWLN